MGIVPNIGDIQLVKSVVTAACNNDMLIKTIKARNIHTHIHKIFNKDNMTKHNCHKCSKQLNVRNAINVKCYSVRVFTYKACKKI